MKNFTISKQTTMKTNRFKKLVNQLFVLTICTVVALLNFNNLQAQNPLAPANNFMIFVEQNSTMSGGDVTGPFATGGNLSINGSFAAAGNYQGGYQVAGESQKVGIYVGGSVSGNSLYQALGNSFVKVGSLSGNTCNVSGNILKVQTGATALLQSSSNQTCAQLSTMGTLNVANAFTTLRNTSTCLAGKAANVSLNTADPNNPSINCTNAVNYIKLTTAQLNSNINLSSNADATHILVINVDCSNTTFTWNGSFKLQNTNPDYTLINFYNTTTINYSGVGSDIMASVLAPNAIFNKNAPQAVEGQVIAKTYTHTSGEIHSRPFLGNVSCTSTPVNTNNCTCLGNLVLNPSFENGITSWNFSGGTLSAGNGGVACGSFSGDLQITAAGAWASQTIGTDWQPGTVVSASVYAGTHDNSQNNWVAIVFLDANNAWMSQSVYVQVDKVLANTPAGPQLYSFSATVPPGAKYTQVSFGGDGSFTKTDQWCVTKSNPSSCNPNDGTAVNGFCAPAATCTSTNTVNWSQTINVNDGTPSTVRLFVGGVTTYTIPASFYPALLAGPSTVTVSDVVSYDGYASRNTVTQPNERWRILFRKSGATVYATPYTNDVADLQKQAYWKGALGVATFLPNGADAIVIEHYSVGTGDVSSPNSVVPASICINVTAATGSIGDRVWFDANGNGIQDVAETTGITGVTVQLKNSIGTVIATTTTNGSGNYLFSNLPAGNYTVVFPTAISGATVTTANVGTDDNVDSDASQTTGETPTIILATGQNITNVDAGYCPTTLALGDRVYYDLNNNGIREAATEAGIPSLTVNLYKDNNNDNIPDGAAIATTTTDVNGGYRFDNLVPGNYIVGVTPPAGYTSSTNAAIDPDNDVDLDDNGTNLVGGEWRGLAVTLTGGGEPLETGNFNNTYDFGFYQPAVLNLGNAVWYDQNNNGTKDATDPAIVGATVNLYLDANNDNIADGAAIATTTTSATGAYNFGSLAPGNYIVGVILPTGYAVQTLNGGDPDNNTDNDNNGTVTTVAGEVRTNAVTLSASGEPDVAVDGDGTNGNLTVDIALKATGSIGDFVFDDLNGNGIQDAGEPGIGSVTVTLTYPNGQTATTTTDANGLYSFTNLAPGTTYSVSFGTPAGYTPTGSNVGTNDALDSDPVGGVVTGVTVTAGVANTTVDAGFFKKLNLGNHVWYDQNNNGTKDATDPAIVGATVNLYLDANNDNIADGAAVATTTTNGTGTYAFSNLNPGNYIVGVIIPTGYAVQTLNGGDPDNNTDNDNNGTVTTVAGEVRTNAVTLSSGGEPTTDGDDANGNLTVDIALKATGSIGDFVFDDLNGNGIQDGGEPGIGSVTVTLTYPNGQTATTTTDANGLYSFTNLAPGTTYSVTFGTPAGYTATSPNIGTNDAVDSDPVNGVVTGVTVTAGTANTTVDAGFFKKLNLGNHVWYDQNNNGTKDATDPAIVGATVNLYVDLNNDNIADGTALATTTTNAAGAYAFSNLNPGNYIVAVIIPAGYAVQTLNGGDPDNNTDNDNNGTVTTVAGEVRTNAVTLSSGGEPTTDGDGANGNLTVDIALKATGSIGDFVFNDINGNGIQDAGEPGIGSVTVTLTYPNGQTATTTTDPNGLYSFTNLAAGTTYSVTFGTPAGFTPTGSNVGTNDAVDSDPVGGVVTGVTVTAGTANTTIDAGYYRVVNLGNHVWYDQNNNGTKDATELGIVGAVVNLYKDDNNDNVADGVAIATTNTIANGAYAFNNLAPGNYIVGVIIPAGYAVQTLNGGDPDNNTDNDNNGTNTSVAGEVRSSAITLAAGTEPDVAADSDGTNGNLTVDFGFKGTGAIGDFVFNDRNGNGIQDAGEPGIGSVTVTLTYPNGQTATTTTDANGLYSFTNLAPGTTYSVTFGTPAGFNPTTSNVGTNDAVDSDPVGGTVTGVTVTAGTTNNTIDAGYVSNQLNLGNYVWEDRNNNGTQNAGEPGVVGATVKLYADANSDNVPDGAALQTTTTNGTGFYNFAGLTPGNYIVGVTLPAGYVATATTATSATPNNDDNTDNNGVTTVSGELRSNFVTLTTGGEPTADGDGNNGNLTVDFGVRGTGAIGDYVWNDANTNGVQDITEVGIQGVTVTLTYPDGSTATTTTNASGNYSFTGLVPGTNYSVTFTTPANSVPSPSNVTISGANDNNDSDPVGGVVSGITVVANTTNNTIDAGFYGCSVASGITGPATICANEGALFTATPAGVGSVYTWTFSGGTPATATGSSATATWSTSGEYAITLVVTKGGCTATYNTTIVITQAVFANAGPDADICQGSSTTLVGGGPIGASYAWTVLSGDPTSIDNGANQSNVLVSPLVTTVYVLTVTQNGCTRTDQVIVFINVNKNPVANAGPNKRTLVGTAVPIGGSPTGTPPLASPNAPLGYIWSPSAGLNDATIANPTATINTPGTYNYQVIVYNLLTGCSDTSAMQIVVEQPVNVGDYVWYDKNNNGVQDGTEKGILGAAVNLYKDVDEDGVLTGAELTPVANTTTNGLGKYAFNNLYGGKYIVGVTPPAGYVPAATTATSSNPDASDNNLDNNGVNLVGAELRSNVITLTAGAEPTTDGDGNNGNLTLDFGFTGNGALGNFVWNDVNRDGLQSAGEGGIAGVPVTLTYPDGTTATTTTNASGIYSFTNLAPGTNYTVTFGTPGGRIATTPNKPNDALDSDPVNGVVTGVVITAGTVNNTVDAGFFIPINIYGNVWNDANALSDNQVNRTSTSPIPNALNVYLVDDATGLVVQATGLEPDGTYAFLDVAINTSYRIVLSTAVAGPGDVAPRAALPPGWNNTGENLGAGANSGSDGVNNGVLFVDTLTSDVFDANFGIRLKNGEVVIG
jgi:SdrD B-like domain